MCQTPVLRNRTKASICVPRMFKSHAWQQYDKSLLQSVNCHDSHAHGHERHGPFTQFAGIGWNGSIRFESSWCGSWYVAGAKPVFMVLDLITGGMPVSIGRLWL
jgi:hypothetical protein